MQIPRIKRGSPEQIFAIWKNTHSAALVDGDCVIFDTAATGNDLGNAVKQSTTAAGDVLSAGIYSGPDLAVGDYGTFLVFGVHPNAKAANAGGSPGVDAGETLIFTTTAGTLGSGAAADDPSFRVGIALTNAAGGRARVFLKMM